nr:retrovirus-related Pol polyprotein from transposon TNT 1-94 [Tanacetum cinerariifolium]
MGKDSNADARHVFDKEREGLQTDFETRFVPQTELSAEQDFWSRHSVQPKEPNLSSSTTIVEVAKELSKVSMVNSSLKKLKFHLASFDLVVKERTTATAITEGTWGFEHTKACFRDEIIPFVKALKELFNSFDQFLIDELTEVQNVFNQIEQAVEQHCVKKIKFQDKMKNVLKDNERLLKQAISVDIVNIVVHDHVNSADKTVNEKVLVIATLKETLRRLKGKVIVNEVVSLHSIDPELLKIDVAPLAPKLRNNRTTHTDYLRHTQEETGDRSQLINFVHKFLGTVKFGNDHVAKIIGYGDYKIGNVTISSVYFVEGLEHNLFSVGQFYDSDLEVAFRQHTCFIRNLDGIDLLTGSRENNLYTLSLQDMMASSPICLLSKGTKTKSWLWHHRLSHLNCGAINHLARQGLVRGLPKLKFEKDHLCSACAMGKKSVNGKKYILIIVDDYSRFTWVKFLRSKDEALDFIIKFLKMIQVRLKVPRLWQPLVIPKIDPSYEFTTERHLMSFCIIKLLGIKCTRNSHC